VGSAVSYGAYTVQGKALRSVWEYPAAVTTAACFAAGLMFLLPLAAGEAWLVGTPDLSLRGWAVLLYLGVVASALTLFLWNYALRSIEASAAAIYVNLIPVVGLIFALALGETASLLQILGGIIAVSGVLLSEAQFARDREPRPLAGSTDNLESLRLNAEGHRQTPPDLAVELYRHVGARGAGTQLLGREGSQGAVEGPFGQDAGEDVGPQEHAHAFDEYCLEFTVGEQTRAGHPEVSAVEVAVGDDGEPGDASRVAVDHLHRGEFLLEEHLEGGEGEG
jgi:uncharacterized membrane protein